MLLRLFTHVNEDVSSIKNTTLPKKYVWLQNHGENATTLEGSTPNGGGGGSNTTAQEGGEGGTTPKRDKKNTTQKIDGEAATHLRRRGVVWVFCGWVLGGRQGGWVLVGKVVRASFCVCLRLSAWVALSERMRMITWCCTTSGSIWCFLLPASNPQGRIQKLT